MSLNTKIIKNYADSLFAQVSETVDKKVVLNDIKTFSETLATSAAMKEVMESPIVDKLYKTRVADAVAEKGNFLDISKKFLYTLIKNSRMKILPNIVDEFESVCRESDGVKLVEVASSTKLGKKEEEYITNMLESELGKKIEIRPKVDKSLLGGIIVKYDSNIIDYSVKGALNRIHRLVVE